MRLRTLLHLAILGASACAKHTPPPKAPVPPPAAEEPVRTPARTSEEDGMSVSGTLGSISDEDVASAFRARWSDVTRCLRETAPRLGYLAGRVELKIRIGKDGAPTQAHVQDSTLGHYAAERCLLEVVQGMRFAAPRGGSEAEFSYPVEYKAPRTAWAVTPWEKDRISPEKLQRNLGALQFCRATPEEVARHKAAPRPKSKKATTVVAPEGPLKAVPANLKMTVYIAPGGKIAAAGLSADGPLDPAMASCFVTSAEGWKLDDPGGRPAKVSFEVAP